MSERVRGRAWLGFRQVAEAGRAGAGDADNTGSGGQAAGPNCWETALFGDGPGGHTCSNRGVWDTQGLQQPGMPCRS